VGLHTLKRRADFIRVRGGLRSATPTLVVEAKSLGSHKQSLENETGCLEAIGPRFGFTVSKKIGKAVVRNLVRRRLKAAAGELKSAVQADFDYVIIARPAAVDRAFSDLRADLAQALARVHRTDKAGVRRARPRPAGTHE
jgi:ribonuclease P protein component